MLVVSAICMTHTCVFVNVHVFVYMFTFPAVKKLIESALEDIIGMCLPMHVHVLCSVIDVELLCFTAERISVRL